MAEINGHPAEGWQKEKDEILACLPNLRAFAISLSGNGDRANDLVQETVLRAFKHIHMFESGTNLQAWLFVILRNLFRSEYRKRRREVEDVDGVYSKTLVTKSDAEDSNELDRLAMGIACLPREQADAVMLVGYLGYSYRNAAHFMGCAEGTIKSRVKRARDHLEKLMVEGEFVKVDVEPLKRATQGVPKSHPYYPLALAYEEMFEGTQSVGVANRNNKTSKEVPQEEVLWNDLVRTGALDGVHTLPEFSDQEFEFK